MDPPRSRKPLALILLFVASANLALFATSAKVEPGYGRIRILSIGEAYYPETRVPVVLKADPRIRYQPVPTNWYESTFASVGSGREDALRFVRQYMPRTYKRLVDSYDVILLSDFDVDVINPTQFAWMEHAVERGGMGLAKYEMNYDPAHWHTFDLFCGSPIYPAFPTRLVEGREFRSVGIRAVPLPGTRRPHPILDLPGMRGGKVPMDIGGGKCGYEAPREGSTVIARFIPGEEAAMVIWKYGEGRSLVSVPGHDTIDWSVSASWPYAADFWINQMWYLAGLQIPPDLSVVHKIREMSQRYASERSMAVSLIEFIERFGAPTWELYHHLSKVDLTKQFADRLYMRDDYAESLGKMEEAFEGLERVTEESVKAKEKALFWIYLTEWCVVAASSTLAGFLLWTLMVRRRLYREVGLTAAR